MGERVLGSLYRYPFKVDERIPVIISVEAPKRPLPLLLPHLPPPRLPLKLGLSGVALLSLEQAVSYVWWPSLDHELPAGGGRANTTRQ